MNDKITTHTRLAVLKHLVKGKAPEVVAAAEKLSRFEIIDIASSHGYPDASKMAKAVELITRKLGEDERQALTVSGRPAPRVPIAVPSPPARPQASSLPPPQQPATVVSQGTTTQPEELSVVVNAGRRSSSKRIQALAERILDDVGRLHHLLEEEQARTEVARQAAEAKAELKRKKVQLEKELAEVKAQLRGNTGTPAPATRDPASAEPTAKEIRDWARRAGVECPASGRVPQSVREAYTAARTEAAA